MSAIGAPESIRTALSIRQLVYLDAFACHERDHDELADPLAALDGHRVVARHNSPHCMEDRRMVVMERGLYLAPVAAVDYAHAVRQVDAPRAESRAGEHQSHMPIRYLDRNPGSDHSGLTRSKCHSLPCRQVESGIARLSVLGQWCPIGQFDVDFPLSPNTHRVASSRYPHVLGFEVGADAVLELRWHRQVAP